MEAQKPSEYLSDKSNVIPSNNRKTEATAEDFKEISDILTNHADLLNGINRGGEASKFYGFFVSLPILSATFKNAEENGFAVIAAEGMPPRIAIFSNGSWSVSGLQMTIQYYANKLMRPDVGSDQVLYVVLDSGSASLYYNGRYHEFGNESGEVIIYSQDNSIKVQGQNIEVNVDDWALDAYFNNQINF